MKLNRYKDWVHKLSSIEGWGGERCLYTCRGNRMLGSPSHKFSGILTDVGQCLCKSEASPWRLIPPHYFPGLPSLYSMVSASRSHVSRKQRIDWVSWEMLTLMLQGLSQGNPISEGIMLHRVPIFGSILPSFIHALLEQWSSISVQFYIKGCPQHREMRQMLVILCVYQSGEKGMILTLFTIAVLYLIFKTLLCRI